MRQKLLTTLSEEELLKGMSGDAPTIAETPDLDGDDEGLE